MNVADYLKPWLIRQTTSFLQDSPCKEDVRLVQQHGGHGLGPAVHGHGVVGGGGEAGGFALEGGGEEPGAGGDGAMCSLF